MKPMDLESQVCFRLPQSLLKRIDVLVQRASKRAGPGMRIGRSDMLRDLLLHSVDAAEKRDVKRSSR